MKKSSNLLSAAAALIIALNSFSVISAAEWKTESGKTFYIEDNGNYAKGWTEIDGKTYFFRPDGEMITKSCKIGGLRYKFASDGVCQGKYTGWTKSASGRRYYKNGVMLTDRWLKTKSGKRYYVNSDGYAATGEAIIRSKAYVFSSKGVLEQGPFELCAVTVTDLKTGKIYESSTNSGTWKNNKKPPVYATAEEGRVSDKTQWLSFTVYNEGELVLEDHNLYFDNMHMKEDWSDADVARIYEPGTSFTHSYLLLAYETPEKGECTITIELNHFNTKMYKIELTFEFV